MKLVILSGNLEKAESYGGKTLMEQQHSIGYPDNTDSETKRLYQLSGISSDVDVIKVATEQFKSGESEGVYIWTAPEGLEIEHLHFEENDND